MSHKKDGVCGEKGWRRSSVVGREGLTVERVISREGFVTGPAGRSHLGEGINGGSN